MVRLGAIDVTRLSLITFVQEFVNGAPVGNPTLSPDSSPRDDVPASKVNPGEESSSSSSAKGKTKKAKDADSDS